MNNDDWLALWSEFDFANPDAGGSRGASRAQLKLAVEVFGERLDIDAAVRDGHLREETRTDRYGVEKPVRYRLNMAGGSA